MRMILFTLLLPLGLKAQVNSESFIVQISDRSMKLTAPEKPRKLFSVIVENRSLSDQVGKFTVGGNIVKYVSVRSGKSQTVEFENKSSLPVFFVPVSPAFQEVEMKFGKKAYEVPPQK